MISCSSLHILTAKVKTVTEPSRSIGMPVLIPILRFITVPSILAMRSLRMGQRGTSRGKLCMEMEEAGLLDEFWQEALGSMDTSSQNLCRRIVLWW
jgi:hypothetical protein